MGVCVKISCADMISQGLRYPLIVPAAPSLQERLAFSYLFASDCISTKNSAKLKNTTVCLIIQCSPNTPRKRKSELERSGFCVCFQRERATFAFPLSSPWHQHATPDWLADGFTLAGLPKRVQQSFFCKRGPLGVGEVCPHCL